MSWELKPCPFCGSNPTLRDEPPPFGPGVNCSRPGCPLWCAELHPEEWNRRHVPPEVQKFLKAIARADNDLCTCMGEKRPAPAALQCFRCEMLQLAADYRRAVGS